MTMLFHAAAVPFFLYLAGLGFIKAVPNRRRFPRLSLLVGSCVAVLLITASVIEARKVIELRNHGHSGLITIGGVLLGVGISRVLHDIFYDQPPEETKASQPTKR